MALDSVDVNINTGQPSIEIISNTTSGYEQVIYIKKNQIKKVTGSKVPVLNNLGSILSYKYIVKITMTYNSVEEINIASVSNQPTWTVDDTGLDQAIEDIAFSSESTPSPPLNAKGLKPTKTGWETSFVPSNNDDGGLQFGRGVDWNTLSWVNPFGNTDRYTDTSGGQVYANGAIVDWETYEESLGEVTSYLLSRDTLNYSLTVQNWFDWLANAPYSDKSNNFNDYEMCNFNQVASILNWSDTSHLSSPPFSYSLINNNARIWTSTTRGQDTNRALMLALNQTIGTLLKTEVCSTILFRQNTLADLGL